MDAHVVICARRDALPRLWMAHERCPVLRRYRKRHLRAAAGMLRMRAIWGGSRTERAFPDRSDRRNVALRTYRHLDDTSGSTLSSK